MKSFVLLCFVLLNFIFFAQDTTFNDVIVTVESIEKKISILEENHYSVKYLERIDGKAIVRRALKENIYLLQKEGKTPVIYSRNRVKRVGDYFILDKTGPYIGLNIGVGSTRWIESGDYDSTRLSTGNGAFNGGLEFGFRIYFNTKGFKYTHGLHLGVRADGTFGHGVGVYAPSFLFGYSSVYKINKTQALEFGLNVGPTFFADGLTEDYFLPIWLFDLAVLEGLTGVVAVKYRYKHVYAGLEFLYMEGKSRGYGGNTAKRQTVSLSVGWVF